MLYKQGVAVSNYPFSLKEADGTAVTTGTTTGVMTKDGVQGATLANATHVGNGVWNISFTALEMDAISLHFLPINSLAVTLGAKIPTYTQLDSNLIQVNGSVVVLNDFKADVSALGTLANQTTINDNVLTRLSTTDYTSTSLVVDGKLDAIITDTNELQTNQGNWVTATGFSTFNPAADVVARVTLVDTTTLNTDMVSVSALATTAQLNDRTVPSAQYSTLVATDIVTAGAITTNAGIVSSDIKKINNVTISGDGSAAPFDV